MSRLLGAALQASTVSALLKVQLRFVTNLTGRLGDTGDIGEIARIIMDGGGGRHIQMQARYVMIVRI